MKKTLDSINYLCIQDIDNHNQVNVFVNKIEETLTKVVNYSWKS